MIPKRFIGENIIHLPTVKTHVFTTTTGAMKNAFGGLLNEHRHWTHPVIHETLVDLLMIQKKIHRGVFAVMDGTFAGDGPGPRCMMPYSKNVILASADQVGDRRGRREADGIRPAARSSSSAWRTRWASAAAIRARSRSSATPRAAAENWHFDGPFKKMTFASRMQHKIYWGPMKKPIEWSLKTVLAPWAYIASVIYHDSFWYPVNAKRAMRDVLEEPVGPAVPELGDAARRTRTAIPRSAATTAQIEQDGRARRSSARSAFSARASRKRPSSRTAAPHAARVEHCSAKP